MYTLFNKRLGVKLELPGGTWATTDLEQAKITLESCKSMVKGYGAEDLVDDFVVIELESEKQVYPTLP